MRKTATGAEIDYIGTEKSKVRIPTLLDRYYSIFIAYIHLKIGA